MTKCHIGAAVVSKIVSGIVSAQSEKSITIHQEMDFTAGPQQLYEVLLDSKQFATFSGRPRSIVMRAAHSRSSKAISSAATWN
jgi:hypothetical protein